MPLQHSNTGETSRFGGFGPLSEFPVLCVPLFPVLNRGFQMSSFSVFGWTRFRRKPPPSKVFFLTPRPFPNPKPLTQNSQRSGKCNHASYLLLLVRPNLSINADTDVLCVSTEAKGCSSQRTEALRATQHEMTATQHAEQEWTAIRRV